jgi:hypothetical protein
MLFSLSAKLVCAATAALMFGSVAVQASEATLLADRAGFLLGHAHRCGIEDARLRHSEGVISDAIAAFALDDEDKETAQTAFAERLLASALAQLLGDPLPSCGTVGAELTRFEQHSRPAMAQPGKREEEMARSNRSKPEATRSGGAAQAKRKKTRKPASTRPEELTPERRAELELQRAAQQMRGRPPSI